MSPSMQPHTRECRSSSPVLPRISPDQTFQSMSEDELLRAIQTLVPPERNEEI